MAELDRFGPDLAGAMANVTDLVVIIDASACLEYVNPFGVEWFGYESADEMIGMSLIDLIHPDDFERVILAMARLLDVATSVPGRPALVRVRRADGTYVRIEANGAAAGPVGTGTGRAVLTARPTTDADLHEQLMSLLTTGAPSEKSFELVPDFGSWRQPNLLHAVFVLDDDGVALAFGAPKLLELGALDDPAGPWAHVSRSGEDLFVAVEELAADVRARAQARGLTFVRARPVVDALHRCYAVVVIAHEDGSPLPAERATLEMAWFALDKMAMVLEMALAWRCQAVELRRAAATDPLTGLANRAGFWSSYRRAPDGDAGAGATRTVTVLCIDLDRFKPVNDTYGHATGDALLVEVADRLRHIVRPADLIARLGGDEFTIVLHDLGDAPVAAIADRVVTELCAPFVIGGDRIEIGASVGVATATVEGFDAAALLDAADMALLQAKSAGRNRWVRQP